MCGCLGDVEDSLRIIEESPMLKNLGDQTGRQKVDNVKAVVGVVDVVKEVCQPPHDINFGKFAKAHLRLNLRHPLAYRG